MAPIYIIDIYIYFINVRYYLTFFTYLTLVKYLHYILNSKWKN